MGQKRLLTQEQEMTVIERYKSGEAVLQIAKDYPVHAQTLHNTLKRYGVEARPELAKKPVNEAVRAQIADACQGGMVVHDVAAQFNVSESTVTRILRSRGSKMPKGRPRSCTINDHAFDVLTPEVAYWVGFLFADGCVHQDAYGSPALVVGLGQKDFVHLEKLRSFLGSTHAISTYPPGRQSFGGPCSYWRARSTRICAALAGYGIVKKRTRVPTDELANSSDFWRGAIDGDGWLGVSALFPHTGLCGQLPILETFQDFLQRNRLASPEITPTDSGVWKVQIVGDCAVATVRALYDDASVSLDRKQTRANAIISGDTRVSEPYEESPSRVLVSKKILRDLLSIEE